MTRIINIFFLAAGLFICSDAMAQPGVGQVPPEIALPDTRGVVRKLSENTGKVVLLDFWASWCGPCRKANPNLVRLYAKYRKKGFEIFGVSIDEDKDDWKKAIINDRMTWTQVIESGGWDGPVGVAFKVEEIPNSYLLDRSGKVVLINPDPATLEQTIQALLKK